MLNYLADTTLQIVTAMILTGLILGYVKLAYGERTARLMWIGTLLGAAGAILMAVLKTNTNTVSTSTWNLRIFIVSAAAFVLFIVFTAVFRKRSAIGAILPPVCLDVILFVQTVYAFTDFFVYPHTIMLTEDSVISTVFLTKMAGVAVGFILTLVAAFAAYHCEIRQRKGAAFVLLALALLITQVKQSGSALSVMMTKGYITSSHGVFTYAKFTLNNSNLFIYLTLGVVLAAALIMWIRSTKVNEPYANPAQHRKIIRKWRMIRRWCVAFVIVCALTVFTMTAVYAIANKPIELAPIEDCEIVDDCLYIPLTQVSDGHLHRFAYYSDNDVEIRVIIIQKPNSTAYGVGMDACEICGKTGYYEKDGNVICNRCDVVMNINTIGYEGGCNPKVIEYTIENGTIRIPIANMLEYEDEFK